MPENHKKPSDMTDAELQAFVADNQKGGWQSSFPPEQRITPASLITILVALGAVAFVMHSCKQRASATPARTPVDYSRTSQQAIGCPTQQGIEFVVQAASRGDGDVAATSLVNNCTIIPAGSEVSVLEAGFSQMQIKVKSTGRSLWVLSDVAFKR